MNGTGMDPQKWSFKDRDGQLPWNSGSFMDLNVQSRFFNGSSFKGFAKSRGVTDFAWSSSIHFSHFNGELLHSPPAFSEVGAPWRAAAAGGCRVRPNAQQRIAVAADAVGAAAVRHVRAEEARAGQGGPWGCRRELTAGVFGWILKPWIWWSGSGSGSGVWLIYLLRFMA